MPVGLFGYLPFNDRGEDDGLIGAEPLSGKGRAEVGRELFIHFVERYPHDSRCVSRTGLLIRIRIQVTLKARLFRLIDKCGVALITSRIQCALYVALAEPFLDEPVAYLVDTL